MEPLKINVGTKYTLTHNGKNISAAAGTYDVYLNYSNGTFYMVAAGAQDPTVNEPDDTWAIKGDVNNTQWKTDIYFEAAGDLLVVKNITFQDSWSKGIEFKLLKNNQWVGATESKKYQLGESIALNNGDGNNLSVNATIGSATYDIYLNVMKNCVCVVNAGAKPTI